MDQRIHILQTNISNTVVEVVVPAVDLEVVEADLVAGRIGSKDLLEDGGALIRTTRVETTWTKTERVATGQLDEGVATSEAVAEAASEETTEDLAHKMIG